MRGSRYFNRIKNSIKKALNRIYHSLIFMPEFKKFTEEKKMVFSGFTVRIKIIKIIKIEDGA